MQGARWRPVVDEAPFAPQQPRILAARDGLAQPELHDGQILAGKGSTTGEERGPSAAVEEAADEAAGEHAGRVAPVVAAREGGAHGHDLAADEPAQPLHRRVVEGGSVEGFGAFEPERTRVGSGEREPEVD